MKLKYYFLLLIAVLFTLTIYFGVNLRPGPQSIINLFVLGTSLLFSLQGIFSLMWMLYAWNDPENVEKHQSPKKFANPQYLFTALLPARHEEKVIRDTITAIDKINYPEHLKQILVLCRDDDIKTIIQAEKAITELGKSNIELVVFNGFPINKPNALNYGLQKAGGNVITIFDAEDEPHPDIYNIINTVMVNEGVDVVQSGVQLMNYNSHWFSALNVMEYYLWFKSGLHFFTKAGQVTPLGGNTVFFKKRWLKKIGGWDKNCLTEDADIGIRLTLAGAKTRVVYDAQHATAEETPNSTMGFIKQRTRWNQGFLQILNKGDWSRLPKIRQRFVALYVLASPMIQAMLVLYLPLGIILALTQELPVWIALISFVPLYFLALQLMITIVSLYTFTKEYKLAPPILSSVLISLVFYPYQLMLIFSAFRAFYRILVNNNAWEKTLHTNAHREMTSLSLTS